MAKLPSDAELEPGARRTHAGLKWLLTLLSAVVTTGLVILLNRQL